MSRFRARPYLSIVTLLAFLAAGSGEAVGAVLCVGSDGHVSLEPALNGVCSDAAVPDAHPGVHGERQGSAAALRASHCGPCVDHPFLANDSGICASPPVVHKTVPVPFAGMTPVALTVPSTPGRVAALLHPRLLHDLPDPRSVSSRTTVLLI